jgi:hypothetical protein
MEKEYPLENWGDLCRLLDELSLKIEGDKKGFEEFKQYYANILVTFSQDSNIYLGDLALSPSSLLLGERVKSLAQEMLEKFS